jgi:ankyrin repeat protein
MSISQSPLKKGGLIDGKTDEIVVEGVMQKKGRKKDWYSIINPWAERRIQLMQSGSVNYYDGDRIRGSIEATHAQVIEKLPEQAEGRQYAFEIISADPQEPRLLLAANSFHEREIWMKCITYVSTGTWEMAKETERIRESRKMPFSVRQWRSEDDVIAISTLPDKAHHLENSTAFSESEESIFLNKCHKHVNAWRDTLPSNTRRVLESLRATLDESTGTGRCGVSINTAFTSTSSSAFRRVVDDLSHRTASEEQSIASFIGFSRLSINQNQPFAQNVKGLAADDVSQAIHKIPTNDSNSSLFPPGPPTVSHGSPKSARHGSIGNEAEGMLPAPPSAKTNTSTHFGVEMRKICEADGGNTNLRKGEMGHMTPSSRHNSAGSSTKMNHLPFCVRTDCTPTAPDSGISHYLPLEENESTVYKWARTGNVIAIAKLCEGGKIVSSELCTRVDKMNSSGQTSLHAVMAYGKPEILKLLLKHDVNLRPHLVEENKEFSAINTTLGRVAGETLLHAAICPAPIDVPKEAVEVCAKGQVECLRLLLKHMKECTEPTQRCSFADINAVSKDQKWTALHKAAWFGLNDHMNALLDYIPTPEDLARYSRHGSAASTPWQGRLSHTLNEPEENQIAESEEEYPYILVNKRDCCGFTALHVACAAGHKDCVKSLIERGYATLDLEGGPGFGKVFSMAPRERLNSMYTDSASISASKFYTIFHLAACAGRSEVLAYLLELENGKFSDADEAVEVSARLKAIICQRHRDTSFDGDLTHMSALSGSVECLKVCFAHNLFGKAQLATGIDPVPTSNSQSIAQFSIPLHFAVVEGHLDAVKYLVEIGSNIHFRNERGRTPVLEAVRSGHTEIMNYLVSIGASIHDMDTNSNNALHLASFFNHIEVVKVLVERYGLYNDHINGDYRSAVEVATFLQHGEIIRYLNDQSTLGQPKWEDAIPEFTNKRRSSYDPASMRLSAATTAVAASGETPAPETTTHGTDGEQVQPRASDEDSKKHLRSTAEILRMSASGKARIIGASQSLEKKEEESST